MNKPEAMSTEEREEWDQHVQWAKAQVELFGDKPKYAHLVVKADDHIKAIQKRNFNLANEYQRLNQILDTEIRKASRSAWYEGYEAGHADEFETAANPYEEE